MPRKSAADRGTIAVDGQSPRLKPPATLTEPELKIFVEIVGNCDPRHFRQSDMTLLARYCQTAVLVERAAAAVRAEPIVDGKPSPWIVILEKGDRALVALALRLRLSPQARVPTATAIRRGSPRRLSYYEAMDLERQGNGEMDHAE